MAPSQTLEVPRVNKEGKQCKLEGVTLILTGQVHEGPVALQEGTWVWNIKGPFPPFLFFSSSSLLPISLATISPSTPPPLPLPFPSLPLRQR